MVPLVDLRRQHAGLKEAIQEAVDRALANSAFVLGLELALFEQEFARYCEAEFAVGVGNGTDALTLALQALGVGPGDGVVTSPLTFIATAEAVSACGAVPVFVDCQEATCTLDPIELERYLRLNCRRGASGNYTDLRTGATLKAIVPVHLYGLPADMEAIGEAARDCGLAVVEDACQAHGARCHGRRVGSLGRCACFSFYPAKNLGALGDGGMVVTNDERLAERVRLLRDHGKVSKYEHAVVGRNSRLDDLQAAVLRLKLRHLDDWNRGRRARAAEYAVLLADTPLGLPEEPEGREHAYHLYVVRAAEREPLVASLTAADIGWGIHYPTALHRTPAYRHLGWREGDFPVSERLAAEVVSLPMFAELTPQEAAEVAGAVRGHFHEAPVDSLPQRAEATA